MPGTARSMAIQVQRRSLGLAQVACKHGTPPGTGATLSMSTSVSPVVGPVPWQLIKYLPMLKRTSWDLRRPASKPLEERQVRWRRRQRRVRVHHLEIEERASIERRGNMGGQLKGDGTVQLGVGNHAPSKGGVGKVTEPVLPPVAPNGELSRRDVGMAASGALYRSRRRRQHPA